MCCAENDGDSIQRNRQTSFKRKGGKKPKLARLRQQTVYLIVLNVGLKYRFQCATIAEYASVVLFMEIVFWVRREKNGCATFSQNNILKGRNLKSRARKNRQTEESDTCDIHQLQRQKQHNATCTTCSVKC